MKFRSSLSWRVTQELHAAGSVPPDSIECTSANSSMVGRFTSRNSRMRWTSSVLTVGPHLPNGHLAVLNLALVGMWQPQSLLSVNASVTRGPHDFVAPTKCGHTLQISRRSARVFPLTKSITDFVFGPMQGLVEGVVRDA